ncbi:MAG: DUF1636 domain-containing protein [Geminicoccaceae bacterium]|nr:DUF1636 domain-containing protein [Geminicoccaceae bacterium]
MTATLIVCDTCRHSIEAKTDATGRTGGERLAAHLEEAARACDGFRIRRFSCLMGCEHHCNVALEQPGKLTYVLGSFEPTAEAAAAIVAFAERYAASETGQVPFRQWPQGVKGHFVARVPPAERR